MDIIGVGVAVAGAGIAGYGAYRWLTRPPLPACEDYMTKEECEAAGCYWYDNACHSAPPTKVKTRMVVTTPPPPSVAVGEEFLFEGYLEDVDGNRLMDKEYQLFIDGVGQTKSRTTMDGYWGYVISLGPGTRQMYVKFEGDVTYEGCEVVARKSF